MRKLKLNVDDLAVESFDPVDLRTRGAGTVRGRESGGDTASSYMEPRLTYDVECTETRSQYATECADTNRFDCSDIGMCTVQNCITVGGC